MNPALPKGGGRDEKEGRGEKVKKNNRGQK